MGQYHIPVNLDKKEFLNPHSLGDGLKHWEMIAGGTGGVGSALILLMGAPVARGGGDIDSHNAGRWHGDRVLIVGDYAEDDDFESEIPASLIYSLCVNADEREGVLEYAEKSENTALIAAIRDYGFFKNITGDVRVTLAKELDWVKYSKSKWGGTNRKIEEFV